MLRKKSLDTHFLFTFVQFDHLYFFPIFTRVIFPMFAQDTSIVSVATSIQSFLNDEWKKSNLPYQEHYLDPLHVFQTDIITSYFVSMTILLLWVIFTWLCYIIQTLQVTNDYTNFCNILSVHSMKPVNISYTLSHPNSFYIALMIFLYVLVWYYSKKYKINLSFCHMDF